MANLSKAKGFPLLKGSIDLLLLLPHYLDSIEDFIHLSTSCKTLHNIYTAHPPLPVLIFELAAASSLKVFEPKPHFLIAGVARQIGEWAIQTPENRTEFHESFETEGILGLFELCKKRGKLTLEEMRDLIGRKSILRSLSLIHLPRLDRPMWHESKEIPYLQIAMFGGLFAATVRSFCKPGVTNPLHTSIRLDWWVKCCPDLWCNDSRDILDVQSYWIGRRQMYRIMEVLQVTAMLQTSTPISMMKRIPKCFVTSAEDCRDISYDNTYHERNSAFSALIYLQGWDSLDLMYQLEIRTHSLNAQVAVKAAMIDFRMEHSQVTNFIGIRDATMKNTCQDLGTVVNIELDTRFVCNRDLLGGLLYSDVRSD
ncbi:hypothetical protein BGAL_0152g00120 [Botrytis galanthina]|uniref:Uncharacterized protein n=1 Tax=Botrytis galanthina TaxID=278940 RepID=A0A4S8QZD3_9HELO|nr:hypothetical protein BGAL_0152g00120 [Botrytis galanthina]